VFINAACFLAGPCAPFSFQQRRIAHFVAPILLGRVAPASLGLAITCRLRTTKILSLSLGTLLSLPSSRKQNGRSYISLALHCDSIKSRLFDQISIGATRYKLPIAARCHPDSRLLSTSCRHSSLQWQETTLFKVRNLQICSGILCLLSKGAGTGINIFSLPTSITPVFSCRPLLMGLQFIRYNIRLG